MTGLILYALLTTAAYYLGSRARVTSWLWSRYPPGFGRFMDCAACSGTWFGFGFGVALAWGVGVSPLGIPSDEWYTPFLIGMGSMVWTPILAGLMQLGFQWNGSAFEEEHGTDTTPK